MESTGKVSDADHPRNDIVIHIDRVEYRVDVSEMTGLQLRELPTPAIGPDRDLYLQSPGHQEDQLITDTQIVTLENGMHFFSAPRTITPGRGMNASRR